MFVLLCGQLTVLPNTFCIVLQVSQGTRRIVHAKESPIRNKGSLITLSFARRQRRKYFVVLKIFSCVRREWVGGVMAISELAVGQHKSSTEET